MNSAFQFQTKPCFTVIQDFRYDDNLDVYMIFIAS